MQASGAIDAAVPRPPRLAIADLVVERADTGRILDRASLVVEPGAVVAITGPSGSGKTTLLHAVAGLVKANAGKVAWGDLDLTKMSERARDRWRLDNVGLVFQDFQLFGELGVLDNILLPIRFDHGRTPQASRQRAAALAARVGLDDRAVLSSALSRGEQQRVAIARALMRAPRLILADEPTASLDPASGAQVADLLIEAARSAAASILMVSHDDALLKRAALVYRLGAGKLEPAQGLSA
jgi:putative ABC transport system ATP-binding protein